MTPARTARTTTTSTIFSNLSSSPIDSIAHRTRSLSLSLSRVPVPSRRRRDFKFSKSKRLDIISCAESWAAMAGGTCSFFFDFHLLNQRLGALGESLSEPPCFFEALRLKVADVLRTKLLPRAEPRAETG